MWLYADAYFLNLKPDPVICNPPHLSDCFSQYFLLLYSNQFPTEYEISPPVSDPCDPVVTRSGQFPHKYWVGGKSSLQGRCNLHIAFSVRMLPIL